MTKNTTGIRTVVWRKKLLILTPIRRIRKAVLISSMTIWLRKWIIEKPSGLSAFWKADSTSMKTSLITISTGIWEAQCMTWVAHFTKGEVNSKVLQGEGKSITEERMEWVRDSQWWVLSRNKIWEVALGRRRWRIAQGIKLIMLFSGWLLIRKFREIVRGPRRKLRFRSGNLSYKSRTWMKKMRV